MKQLMTIGRLLELEIYDPKTGRSQKQRPKGKWLASSADGRQLYICTVKGSSNAKATKAVAARHKKFHRAGLQGMWEADHPTKVAPTRQIGLLKSLTYSVPRSKIKSPGKNPYRWHHAFGDTGHKGGDYPPKVFPAVIKDKRGNLFIRRRPGNIYRTTDWIRG
jgi:hypothetical protein